ncbi:MAG: DinB family protein [Bryobacteraceae bacterium]|nr:DinB family protein [Bryobacteraceae bacterium]
MTLAQSMLAEFEQESHITRKFLERLPEDKLSWKPHVKSMSAGQLALHIAMTPGGIVEMARQDTIPAPEFPSFPEPSSVQEVLNAFDNSIAVVRSTLPDFTDAIMQATWRLTLDGKELLAIPRAAFLRNILFNHCYQHRGQFGVYLRLLDVAVPSSYGPSADEMPEFMQQAQAA